MKIEILGSGGAITTPRPLCRCRVCEEARREGLPFSRTGPSVFIHGPDLLFDTPEEIKHQLNRSGIGRVAGCFYSHWHPDHVMGRRVWEMHKDFRNWPPAHGGPTRVYLPERVAADFKETLGSWDHLTFLADRGLIQILVLEDGAVVEGDGWTVQPFPLALAFVHGFRVEGGGRRILIIMDELKGWKPGREEEGLDLAILPMGIVEFDVFTGQRVIPAEHPVLRHEATFRETLEVVRQLDAQRIILSHIEEVSGLSHTDLERLEKKLNEDGLPVSFAFDTMVVGP